MAEGRIKMTSMLCQKQAGGQVKVYDREVTGDLATDGDNHIRTMLMSREKTMKKKGRRPHTTPSPTRNMDSSSLIGQTMRVQHWLNEKQVKSLQKKSDLESKSAMKLYTPLLETEDSFVKDVESFINTREVLNLRKKEVLHKKWNERVYKPLRKKIITAMDSTEWPEVDRRKRELHKQYLEFTNDKGHVFLDTMDPEEYYAMALNGHRPAPIKIETRPLRDPLLSQGRERNEEDRTILRCITGQYYTDRDIEQVKLPAMPLVPLGRHGTDSIRWLEMPLSNIESTPRISSRKRMTGGFNESQVDFDVWSKTQYDAATVDKELAIQKKRMFAENEKPPLQPSPPVRPPLKPAPRHVNFHDPVNWTELEHVHPLSAGLQRRSIDVGGE